MVETMSLILKHRVDFCLYKYITKNIRFPNISAIIFQIFLTPISIPLNIQANKSKRTL
jgi:hypothetical protein